MYTFDDSVFTQTEQLEQRTDKILDTLREGNVWRYGNGISFTLGVLGLLMGNVSLSPLVLLLLTTNVLGAGIGYLTYCLDEGEQLGILPNFLPLIGGEEQTTIAGLLTDKERSHYQAIRFLGAKKVEKIERAGGLEILIEQIEDIADRPGADSPEVYTKLMRQVKESISLGEGGSDQSTSRRVMPSSNPSVNPWDGNQRTSRLALPVATADNLPPIRDLPHEIALLKGHVVLVAKTTAGKSTALVQVIKHCLEAGHNVLTIDGKGCLALRDAGGVYRHANTSDRAVACLRDIQGVIKTLKTRQDLAMKGHTDFTPMTVIVDELNLVRKFLKKDSQESLDDFTEAIAELLLQGASSKIYLRLSSHSSRLKNLGLDGGEADSLSFIGLGRNGSFESLEDILEYQVMGRKSKKFQDELDNLVHADFRETLCFSTIAPMGFYRLPWVDQSAAAFTAPPELDIRSSLDRLYQTSTTPEPTPKTAIEDTPASKIDLLSDPELEDMLGKVLAYAKRKERVKPSDISSGLRSCRGYSAGEIMQLFDYLHEAGEGIVRDGTFTPS